jgi:hypothetical protein
MEALIIAKTPFEIYEPILESRRHCGTPLGGFYAKYPPAKNQDV